MILAKEFEGELWIKASLHNRAVKQAVEAEREACAALCADWNDSIAQHLANTIRARGQK